jgi:hypothetical protein
VTFSEALHHGTYTDYFTGETVTFAAGTRLSLEPWSFRIYVR